MVNPEILANGYGSIPINTIFSGMNIHLPAILMFTRGTRVLTHPQMALLNSGFAQRCIPVEMSKRFRGQARNVGHQSVESHEHGEARQERLRQRFTQPGNYGNYGGYNSYGGCRCCRVPIK